MTGSARGTVDAPGSNVRQKAGGNREILDTSPGTLIAMRRYKAERTGGWFAIIGARNTSQQCPGCGATVRNDVDTRIHQCTQCNLEFDRDMNAARNILNRAVAGPWSGFATQLPNAFTGRRRSRNLTAKIAA